MSDDDFEPEALFSAAPNERALDLALHALRMGHLDGAVLHLRRLLGSDPQHATGHALLARVLVVKGRLYAAEHEALAALAIDPELEAGHLAMGFVHLANRKLKDSRKAFERVLELDPESVQAMLGLASLARVQGKREEERRELERALQFDAESEETLVALGNWHLVGGQLDEATRYAESAKDLVAEDADVLVLIGHIALRRGDVERARDHALWALQNDATNASALGLMASIQARQSVFLGLWWRYSVWMQGRGDTGQIAILIAGWFLFTLGRLVSKDFGVPELASAFQYVWLAICVYSWVGPGLFARAVQKELEQVRLKGDF